MPNLRHIADYQNRGTVLALTALLEEARAGHISGVAMCYKMRPGGSEEVVMTGYYEKRGSEAVAAALKLSWRLTQELGEPPPSFPSR